MTVIQSYGIVLFSYNEELDCITVMLIRKRCSYGFLDFIHMRYKSVDTQHLKSLFDEMTVDEKFDIISLDFDNLINKRMLINFGTHYNIYEEATEININNILANKNKYNKLYNNKSGKHKLKSLIRDSSNIQPIWEPPRGRRSNKETEIEAAMRETYEETMIKPEKYEIMLSAPTFKMTQYSKNLIFSTIYYPAFTVKPISDIKINFGNYKQVLEIGDVKFVPIKDLDTYNIPDKIEFMRYVKYIRKKYRLYRYYTGSTFSMDNENALSDGWCFV